MRQRVLAAIGAALVYLTLVSLATWNDSATYDEPSHLMSGYLALSEGRYDVNSFHPPLSKLVAALPLLWYQPSFDKSWLDRERPKTSTRDLAAEWFWKNERDPQTMLGLGRASLQLFHAFLIALILYLLWGTASGKSAAGAFFVVGVLSPPFLGLSAYTITDVTSSLFLLCSLLSCGRLLGKPQDRRATLLLFFSLLGGMASKHSFLLLPVLISVAAPVYGLVQKSRGGKSADLLGFCGRVMGTTFVAFVAVNGLYAFCMRGMDSETVAASIHRSTVHQPHLALLVDKPVFYPLAYFMGGVGRAAWMVKTGGGITTSFMSRNYQGGEEAYFAVILLAKENPFVIAILLWACFVAVRDHQRGKNAPDSALMGLAALTCICYFAVASTSSLNIGFRHILPAYLCGALAVSLLPPLWKRKALVLLLLARITSLILSYPHYLGYFNVLAGGVEQGYKVSVICDADWSQDFLRLRHYMESRKEGKVIVYAASPLDREYYLGPYFKDPDKEETESGDLIAVSTTYLQIPSYLRGSWRAQVERTRGYPKVGQIGGSIVIFRVP